MKHNKLYPLIFYPILMDRIWGSNTLITSLNKKSNSKSLGESWELSSIEENVSIVSNGHYKDYNINNLTSEFPNEILGEYVHQRFGDKIPLLFKFIDANLDLSIQVHPNDEQAMKKHNSYGKTEMWYVMKAKENSKLIVGFKKDSNMEEYQNALNSSNLIDILNTVTVSEGDIYFIPSGTIHAIGSGILIAEIQQTSDITYRLYDYKRTDNQGNTRELHNELAIDTINYKSENCKVEYIKEKNKSVNTVNCDYFNTNIIDLDGEYKWKSHIGSFTVLMCAKGNCQINIDAEIYNVTIGQTVLLPAILNNIHIIGKATLLEIWIE